MCTCIIIYYVYVSVHAHLCVYLLVHSHMNVHVCIACMGECICAYVYTLKFYIIYLVTCNIPSACVYPVDAMSVNITN